MPSQPVIRRIFLVPVLAMTLAVFVAACGGGSAKPRASSPAKPTATPSAPSASAEKTQIKSNWVAFFSGKTPTLQRVKLLQNGQQYEKLLAEQAMSPMASGASAQVTKVTVVSPAQAEVTYSVLVNGSAALKNQTGVAVRQNGTWKVGDRSYCGLLAMQNGGSTSSMPALCRTAASASATPGM